MGLDSSDYALVRSIRDALAEGNDSTAKYLRQMAQQQLKAQQEQTAAFNRVALALENLTVEVRGLRDDLAPQMEKKKLPPPKPPKH